MRIAYCTNVRLPSERAHGHQIAQVCDALDKLGHDVTLYAPYRQNIVKDAYHAYYRARPGVKIRYVGSFDAIRKWWLPSITKLWVQNAMLRKEYATELDPDTFDLLYTRVPALLPALIETGIPTIIELHSVPYLGRKRFLQYASECKLIVCLTAAQKKRLISFGLPAHKIMVEGDGVDLERFKHLPSKESIRKEIGLPEGRVIVGYIGRLKTLEMEKGVKHLLEALKELQPQKKYLGFIVGGSDDEKMEYMNMAVDLGLTDEDVWFMGDRASRLIPLYIAACDICTMPFPDLFHYRYNMSPLKMFEYMAAERPIITSDLPTIRDVLSEDTAYFCHPDDPSHLAQMIEEVVAHPEEAEKKATTARELVKRYSWEERMKRVLC